MFKSWYSEVSKVCDPWLIPVREDKSHDVSKGESSKDRKYRLEEKEAIKRLEEGENVGIYLSDDLAVWDVDDPERASEIVEEGLLAETLFTSSRTGKPHVWFKNRGVKGRDIPDVIEQRTEWRYVLTPRSCAYKRRSTRKPARRIGLYDIENLTKPIELGPESPYLPDELEANDIFTIHVSEDESTVKNDQGESLDKLREEDNKLDALLAELNPGKFDYPSRSEADMAVMIKLLQKGFDDSQVIHIVKKFSPYEKTKRDDYVEGTLSKAKEAVKGTGKGERGQKEEEQARPAYRSRYEQRGRIFGTAAITTARWVIVGGSSALW